MKKLLCMVIAVVMVLSMGVVAFAEENRATVYTTLDGAKLTVGEPFEFTVTTEKNNEPDVNVIGTSTFSKPEDIEKLEYFEPSTNQWIDITNAESFGPAGGFPLQDATSKFRVTFNTSGDYSLDFVLSAAGQNDATVSNVVCRCHADFTVVEPVPVPPSISTNLDGMTFEKGVAKEFTVTIHRGNSQAISFAYELRFGEDLVPAKLEYYGEGGWEPATNKKAELDGNALRGRDITFANSNADEYTLRFRATFDKTGEASLWAWVETTYGSVYNKVSNSDIDGSYRVINSTFNPAPAEDPVIVDLDGADEAEEANPNTGALVLVPAVVALAAVTGIMVSKRK